MRSQYCYVPSIMMITLQFAFSLNKNIKMQHYDFCPYFSQLEVKYFNFKLPP